MLTRAPRKSAIGKEAERQGIGCAEGAGFGEGGQAAEDAADDDDRDAEGRQGGNAGQHDAPEADALVAGIAAPPRYPAAGDQQRARHQQARHDAGGEQLQHRDVAQGRGIDDHDHAGRDDRPDDRRAGGYRGAVGGAVAFAFHGRDQSLADGHRVGHRGARDAGEEDADGDVDVAQGTRHAPEQAVGKSHHSFRESRAVHDLGREDEIGHGDEHESGDAGEKAVGDNLEIAQAADRHRAHQPGRNHDQTYRYADSDQEQKSARGPAHGSAPSSTRPCTRCSSSTRPDTGTDAATHFPDTCRKSETMISSLESAKKP